MRICPAIVAAIALLSGCAHSYLDRAGNRRVIGWVDLTLPPAIAAHDTGADWIRLRTFGLAISSSPIGNTIDLGYSDNTVAVVRNNSCVAFPPITFSSINSTGASHANFPNKQRP